MDRDLSPSLADDADRINQQLEDLVRQSARTSPPTALVLQRLVAIRRRGGSLELRGRIGNSEMSASAAFPTPAPAHQPEPPFGQPTMDNPLVGHFCQHGSLVGVCKEPECKPEVRRG